MASRRTTSTTVSWRKPIVLRGTVRYGELSDIWYSFSSVTDLVAWLGVMGPQFTNGEVFDRNTYQTLVQRVRGRPRSLPSGWRVVAGGAP